MLIRYLSALLVSLTLALPPAAAAASEDKSVKPVLLAVKKLRDDLHEKADDPKVLAGDVLAVRDVIRRKGMGHDFDNVNDVQFTEVVELVTTTMALAGPSDFSKCRTRVEGGDTLFILSDAGKPDIECIRSLIEIMKEVGINPELGKKLLLEPTLDRLLLGVAALDSVRKRADRVVALLAAAG